MRQPHRSRSSEAGENNKQQNEGGMRIEGTRMVAGGMAMITVFAAAGAVGNKSKPTSNSNADADADVAKDEVRVPTKDDLWARWGIKMGRWYKYCEEQQEAEQRQQEEERRVQRNLAKKARRLAERTAVEAAGRLRTESEVDVGKSNQNKTVDSIVRKATKNVPSMEDASSKKNAPSVGEASSRTVKKVKSSSNRTETSTVDTSTNPRVKTKTQSALLNPVPEVEASLASTVATTSTSRQTSRKNRKTREQKDDIPISSPLPQPVAIPVSVAMEATPVPTSEEKKPISYPFHVFVSHITDSIG